MKLNENYFLTISCVFVLRNITGTVQKGESLITSLISFILRFVALPLMKHTLYRQWKDKNVGGGEQTTHKLQSINLLQPCLTSFNSFKPVTE